MSMYYYDVYYPDYLYHFGVKGMKWGHRKRQAFSAKAAGHRVAAGIYGINQRVYKNSNKALSSINATAKTQQLKKAEQAQTAANQRREAKQVAKQNMTPEQKAASRKKAVTVGTAVVGAALATYGAYKVKEYCNRTLAMKDAREYAQSLYDRGLWDKQPPVEWYPKLQ